MLSFYQKQKLNEKRNDAWLAMNRHLEEIKGLEKRIQADPNTTAINNDFREEIKTHRDDIKRLQKEIDTIEAQL